ncbi:MAG: tetratricopeptide repeat protein [Bacteroidales bacterium]
MSLSAQRIRVQGNVKDDKGRALAGVTIRDSGEKIIIGATDDDGKYSILVDRDDVLLFESIGCEDKREKVRGRQIINVVMVTQAIQIKEVEIVSQQLKKILPEPTDIEVKGNYFHLRTRFKIPNSLFESNTRLVIQPFIYNITAKKRMNLRPFVYDGSKYSITQERMYTFNPEKDPLNNFVSVQESRGSSDLMPYHDSIYVENPKHDFRADVVMGLENYRKVFYRDSFVIARGTVNPLRFFEYSLNTLDITDPQYIPQPALQLMDDRGEVELNFAIGQSKIDLKDPKNASEITNLRSRLKEIEVDPDMTLQGFDIKGIASPEGIYNNNLQLAKRRMQSAVAEILSNLDSKTREFMKIKTDAIVDSWEVCAKLMEQDSLLKEASEIRAIVSKFPNSIDHQSNRIRNLSFYKTVLPNYLSKMRRVEYQFEYSVFRILKDNEIVDLYKVDPKKLTRYEYYRMFEMNQDTAVQRRLYEQSLELFPRFLLAANRLAVLDINQDRSTPELLEPYVAASAPKELLVNQAIICLENNLYSKADSIMQLIPNTAEVEHIRTIISVLNGDYESGASYIMSQGGLNEVLLLLAKKQNELAWEKAKLLSSDIAVHEYVKAVAANRLDKVMEAILHIENAFALDPYLQEVAKVDGDVLDLLQ